MSMFMDFTTSVYRRVAGCLYQSPSVVTLPACASSTPLYCIGSNHTDDLHYNWECGDTPIGISSGILSGRYTCTITDNYEVHVSAEPNDCGARFGWNALIFVIYNHSSCVTLMQANILLAQHLLTSQDRKLS